MVLLLSGHANQSAFVNKEVERAISKGKVVIPLRIQDVQPSRALELFISSTQWIDAWAPAAGVARPRPRGRDPQVCVYLPPLQGNDPTPVGAGARDSRAGARRAGACDTRRASL